MRLDKLYALNFKNYEELDISLHPEINVFLGKNGSGKTNLLDAIYYLSLTKSAFSSVDAHAIRHGQNFFMLKGTFRDNAVTHDVSAANQTGLKKVFREDQHEYEKLSDHIGKYPVVLIAPDDTDLVKEGSDLRRKFFDGILSQIDHRYLEDLMAYSHAVKQRNSLLKIFNDSGRKDMIALQVYDELLIRHGNYLFEKRSEFINEFQPIFHHYFNEIVQQSETTSIRYESGLNDDSFQQGLSRNLQKDLILQRSNFGVHRDDYIFQIGNGDLKRLGSQGQQKSFIIALKLAQHRIIEKHKSFKPILLLDDIFDKLDDDRIQRLLQLIKSGLGQIFITDARPHRTQELLDNIDMEARIFQVDNGKINLAERNNYGSER